MSLSKLVSVVSRPVCESAAVGFAAPRGFYLARVPVFLSCPRLFRGPLPFPRQYDRELGSVCKGGERVGSNTNTSIWFEVRGTGTGNCAQTNFIGYIRRAPADDTSIIDSKRNVHARGMVFDARALDFSTFFGKFAFKNVPAARTSAIIGSKLFSRGFFSRPKSPRNYIIIFRYSGRTTIRRITLNVFQLNRSTYIRETRRSDVRNNTISL